MLLHIDGSQHRWFQDERWYDLIVILGRRQQRDLLLQLGRRNQTVPVTVMVGLKQVVERKGVFCALYSDRGSHFWLMGFPLSHSPDDGCSFNSNRTCAVLRKLGHFNLLTTYPFSALAAANRESLASRQVRATLSGLKVRPPPPNEFKV
jgi:hypothetical protein